MTAEKREEIFANFQVNCALKNSVLASKEGRYVIFSSIFWVKQDVSKSAIS